MKVSDSQFPTGPLRVYCAATQNIKSVQVATWTDNQLVKVEDFDGLTYYTHPKSDCLDDECGKVLHPTDIDGREVCDTCDGEGELRCGGGNLYDSVITDCLHCKGTGYLPAPLYEWDVGLLDTATEETLVVIVSYSLKEYHSFPCLW